MNSSMHPPRQKHAPPSLKKKDFGSGMYCFIKVVEIENRLAEKHVSTFK
jgi:hypothetical protein